MERTAPALERQRETRSTQLAEKRRQQAQRDKERETAHYTIAGVDLRKEMKRLVRLEALGGPGGGMARRPPKLEVRRHKTVPRTAYGRAWPWENRILINDYPGCDAADVRETLLHELVHIYDPMDRSDRRWHGEAFQRKMRDAFREAYGLTPRGAAENRYHGRYARALREKETCCAA